MQSLCPSREHYERLLHGLLNDAEEQRLEAHVKSCDSCLATLEELTAVPPQTLRPDEQGPHLSLVRDLLDLPTEDALETHRPARDLSHRLQQGLRSGPSTTPLRRTKPQVAEDEDGLPQVEGYKVHGILGRGGMGVVYKAEQLGLHRLVALKMIRGGILADLRSRSRFRTEVTAVARLQHPNIVQIFEVGEAERLPYYSLEYIEGGSLADRLAGLPQPPGSAAQLVELVARAVHYAHERGIVHRDLKPANILLTAEGAPKIADFGLAKLLEGEPGAATNVASTAALIQGTPCYMAPEQANSGTPSTRVGPTADVYALGVILYEMLTGQPPFQSPSPLETALQVLHTEPTPPRRFRPELSRDLETICLKCLAKDPARRFASALELAEDLRRFRAGEPIRARPVSRSERLWRWSRRNPLVATLLASLAVVLLGGLGLVTWKWRAEVWAVNVARQEKQQADEARHDADWWAARGLVDQAINQGDHGNIDRALLLLARALELAVTSGDADLERAIRLNLALWRRPLIRRRALLPHGDWVWAVAYSPDGKLCATGSRDRTARLWDTATGEPVGEPLQHDHAVWAVAFSPDGKRLLTGSGDDHNGAGAVRLWEVPTGKPLGQPFACAPAGRFVAKLAFGPDGRTILVVGLGEAHLCTLPADGEQHREPACLALPHPEGVVSAVLSPDGRTVLTGGKDGTARLWDTATAQPIGPALEHTPPGGFADGQQCRVSAVAFSPDGQLILTGTQVVDTVQKRFVTGEARLWRTRTGTQVGEAWPHPGPIKTVVFSPDGRRALSGTLVVGQPADQSEGSRSRETSAGLNSHELSYRGAALLWDVTTGKPLGPVMKQSKPVWAAAFSPDGRILLTGSEGGEVQFWLTATGLPLGAPISIIGNVNSVVFSPDGTTALTSRTYEQAAATLCEVPHGPGDVVPGISAPGVRAMTFAPDGAKLVTANGDGVVQVWDVAAARPTGPPLQQGGPIHAVAWSRDGKIIATAGREEGGVVRLWDANARTPLGQPLPYERAVLAVAFSPDARLLLTSTDDGMTRVQDAIRGRVVGEPLRHVGPIRALAFHPDGKTFVIPTGEGKVGQWDTATGRPCGAGFQHQRAATAVAFNPDGTTLATGSLDQTAALWDVVTGRALSSPLQHEGEVLTVAFSCDGQKLLTGSDDGAARLWDVATGVRLGPRLVHSGPVLAAFAPGSDRITTIAADGPLRWWDVPPAAAGEVQGIKEWVEALTGKELTDNGLLRELDGPALQQLRGKSGNNGINRFP
jgi:WD40 repeat protein/serine/threonine protein kinase